MAHYLDEEAVRGLLQWEPLIAAMEGSLRSFSRGEAVQPMRSVLTVETGRRFFGVMPAVLGDVMGAKLVTFYPGNADRGAPTHQATIVLYDAQTGEPIAAMDGRLITEMRTAAVSAAVTKYLSAPESGVLALLGSGVQARAHLGALSSVRHYDEVRVWSRDPAHARRFADAFGALPMDDAEAAVRDADVVVTATAARQPILRGAWLRPGAHVNAVGSSRPDWRELDDEAMGNTVVVDSREAAAKEAGDVVLAGAAIAAEAGEVFGGDVVIRSTATTVFKSVGLAVEDVAAARLVAASAGLIA